MTRRRSPEAIATAAPRETPRVIEVAPAAAVAVPGQ